MSSGIIQIFCHIVDEAGCYGRVILLPFILFVVPYGTYLNYDEDIDILVEFCFMLIQLELIGFSFYSIMFCFYGYSFNSCLTFI